MNLEQSICMYVCLFVCVYIYIYIYIYIWLYAYAWVLKATKNRTTSTLQSRGIAFLHDSALQLLVWAWILAATSEAVKAGR